MCIGIFAAHKKNLRALGDNASGSFDTVCALITTKKGDSATKRKGAWFLLIFQ